jgi:hypothetical protein
LDDSQQGPAASAPPPNPLVKEELAGIRLTLKSLKKTWEGIIRNIGIDEFAIAFSWWLDHCNSCIEINAGYIEKS